MATRRPSDVRNTMSDKASFVTVSRRKVTCLSSSPRDNIVTSRPSRLASRTRPTVCKSTPNPSAIVRFNSIRSSGGPPSNDERTFHNWGNSNKLSRIRAVPLRKSSIARPEISTTTGGPAEPSADVSAEAPTSQFTLVRSNSSNTGARWEANCRPVKPSADTRT